MLRVLLELRAELGIVLAAAHVNHGLRGDDSDADEHFVADLAKRHELQFFTERFNVAEHAAAQHMSLEEAGRELRYPWLTQISVEHRCNVIATAHTQDDQAETVLMKFLRGAGTRGLAGIHPVMKRGQNNEVRVVRPLLVIRRPQIETYLASIDQPWREDESNLDRRFLRNRVRHELLPLIERDYNPNIREVLSEMAEINRGEELYWRYQAWEMLRRLRDDRDRIRVEGFDAVPEGLQRRVLRRVLDELNIAADFQHVERLRLCATGKVQRTELPEGWRAERERQYLVLRRSNGERAPVGYKQLVPVPGEVELKEIGCTIQILPVPADFAAEVSPGTLLRADRTGDELWVRNWQPGDRYHLAYGGGEHKLKELFLEWKIPASERALWPVMLKGTDIVWVRDLPVADAYCWRQGDGDALRVECIPG